MTPATPPFYPFYVSVEGLLGLDAEYTFKGPAIRLLTKWKKTYSTMCGYVKNRVAITLIRATHCYIRGTGVMVHKIRMKQSKWEDRTGLYLF